jgi:hypothetical protein
MSWHHTLAAAAMLACSAASGCTLVALEHRTGRELMRAPLPERTIALEFVHSVLGTAVHDRYAWRRERWVLVEEQFEGEGYGLPHAAATGETLAPAGSRGRRLLLERDVAPLVVRPVQAMTLRLGHPPRSWPLAALGTGAAAIELTTEGC